MKTLSSFQWSQRGRNTQGEKQAEALGRIVSVLLQGIALHGFEYDSSAFSSFQEGIRKLRSEFDRADDEDSAMLIAISAIRLLEEHHEAAQRQLRARQNEVESVIGVLSESLLEVAQASPAMMLQVKEIERDIAAATRPEAITAARFRLSACVQELLREMPEKDARRSKRGPTFPDIETDYVTGLPDAAYALEVAAGRWKRRSNIYVAAFALDRLESINLRFGFKAGDELLLLLSQQVGQHLQPGDQLFRWRGPCLVMLLERETHEGLVAAEISRIAGARMEHAITVRDREVMVPASPTWNLFPLDTFGTSEELATRLNDFALNRSRSTRQQVAAAGGH